MMVDLLKKRIHMCLNFCNFSEKKYSHSSTRLYDVTLSLRKMNSPTIKVEALKQDHADHSVTFFLQSYISLNYRRFFVVFGIVTLLAV